MTDIENICIICYNNDVHHKLCKKCIYMYCNKCASIINYNCCICYRNVKNTPINHIMVFDIFDNDDFLNDMIVNDRLWVFMGIYHIIRKTSILFLMAWFSLPIILFIFRIIL